MQWKKTKSLEKENNEEENIIICNFAISVIASKRKHLQKNFSKRSAVGMEKSDSFTMKNNPSFPLSNEQCVIILVKMK